MSDPIDFKIEHVTAAPGGIDLVRIHLCDGPKVIAQIDMPVPDFARAILTGQTVTAALDRPRKP